MTTNIIEVGKNFNGKAVLYSFFCIASFVTFGYVIQNSILDPE